MKFRWLIYYLIFQLNSVICAAQQVSRDVILAGVDYHLSDDEVDRYSEEAMRGSPEAALKLTNFYWMRSKPNHTKAKYWALVGAENGSSEAQFRAFQGLRASKNLLDQKRALFWLKKSADQGYSVAAAILKSCPDVLQSTPSHTTPCFGPGADQ